LWREGLLWAFSPRAVIEKALMQHPPGTFVARFSESNAGHFAIAYRAYDTPVRHYLLRPEEISAQKTLPDFLCEIPDLTTVLRVLYNDFGEKPLPPLYVPVSKSVAMRHLCTPREEIACSGYDTTIGQAPGTTPGLPGDEKSL